MDTTEDKLVGYAAGLRYADLTPAAIHAVKRSVVDSIGCALGAYHAEPVPALRRMASLVTSAQPATVIGTRSRSSPDMAGFVNSAMIRHADFSDDYFGARGDSGPHPSDNIGGVLAATETAGGDGKTLILGIALAYEACGQIMDRVTLSVRGWDYPIVHSISTALGAAKVLNLPRTGIRDALALAIVPNITLRQTRHGELSNWKGLAGPNGGRNGLFAAMLAQHGISGPASPFEGSAGFMQQLNNRFELDAFGGNGVPFKVEGTYFKHFPIVYSGQLPVWTALELRTKVKLQDVEAICVHLANRYAIAREDHPQYWDPKTRETADHSLPYLIGAALHDGEVTPRTLTPERFRDPAILALVQKIRFEKSQPFADAFPRIFNCRMEATLKSGQVVVVHQTNPKGHPANPMSDAEINQKFLAQADTALAAGQSRRLLDQLWQLENATSLEPLFALMAATD